LTIEAQATIRYVSKTGTSQPPYTSWQTAADSIQKCINICVDGDTIYVANGVYKENLVINTAISLIGSSMDSTVIDGRGLANFTMVFNNSGNIENFKIFGNGYGVPNAYAIWAPIQLTQISIQNCQISETSVVSGCISSSLIAVNVLVNESIVGLSFASGNPSNIHVENSLINVQGANSKGISFGFASETIAEIKNSIILYSGTDTPESGISIGAVKKVYLYNNLISGFKNNIFVDIIVDSLIVRNNVLMNQNYGGVTGSILSINYPVYTNNLIIKDNNTGIYGWPVISNYNLFWNNSVNRSTGALGDSDCVADPMFVKDTVPTADDKYDYHLQAFSPAIDKGDPNILDLDVTRSDIGLYGGPFGEIYTYQDLAPLAPRNLSAVVDSNTILVKWNKNTEADTSFYKVYRDTVSGFTIDSTKLVSSSADTFFVQPNPHINTRYVYKVTCVDNQGNESKPSVELVVNITSVSTNDYPMTISDYILYQNYPNPFNPSTKIGYQIKERAYVKLMVYDIKGELVSVLVNKEQNTGYYEVDFSSSSIKNQESSIQNLASGIYLYRIEVIGEGRIPVYTEMKKMLMLK
jgi:hypothetical protein